MKTSFFIIALLFLFNRSVYAQNGNGLQVNLENGTNSEQFFVVEQIKLLKLGTSMQQVAAKDSVSKQCQFDNLESGVRYLIQANYKGINYNQSFVFDTNQAAVTLTVFEPTTQWPDISVSLNHIFFDLTDAHTLSVVEEIHAENKSNLTYQTPDGTLKLYYPKDAVDRTTTAQMGSMPLPAGTLPQPDGSVAITFPLRPGKTIVTSKYTIPYNDRYAFENKYAYPLADPVAVLITPLDMQVESAQFAFAYKDSMRGLQGFRVDPLETNEILKIQFTGGTSSATANPDAGAVGEVLIRPNRMSQYKIWIIAVSAGVLFFGLFISLVKSKPQKFAGQAIAKYQQHLMGQLADLELRYRNQEISTVDYEIEKGRLKSGLANLPKALHE